MQHYLRTFHPLCSTNAGVEAVENHQLPPYIDGSCRREPDFQNQFPCITGLCTPRFSKLLNVGDIVVYATIMMSDSKMVVAVLEVIETVESHVEAKEWYDKRGLKLPNNLMIKGNQPNPFDKTHKDINESFLGRSDEAIIRAWDSEYKQRAKKFPEVAICNVWNNKLFLYDPPTLTRPIMKKVFNGVPVTRKEYPIKKNEWQLLQPFLK